LVVRREALIKCGGWDEKYWPGEDTLLSLSLRRVGRVIEASDVVVFHHRKPLFKEHLKQISRFALHRGFFAKKYPGNSLKLTYLLPSLLILFLAFGGVISCFSSTFRVIYFSLLLAYLTLALVNASLARDVKLFFPVWIGTILTHITYGTYFLIGLMKKELER
jgi:GT2 family glycosyltransferase